MVDKILKISTTVLSEETLSKLKELPNVSVVTVLPNPNDEGFIIKLQESTKPTLDLITRELHFMPGDLAILLHEVSKLGIRYLELNPSIPTNENLHIQLGKSISINHKPDFNEEDINK